MVGLDEVGRGCLAGPLLVVAASNTKDLPEGLNDSKKLSREQRQRLHDLLLDVCQFGEGWVSASEINKRGLAGAMRLGIQRALRSLGVDHQSQIIMDGPVNYLPRTYANVQCLIDADASVPLVSAASIYAKVKRDQYMTVLAKRHPHYGFEKHVGYGTAEHLAALEKHGVLKRIHRLSFEPVAKLNRLDLWPQAS